MDESKKMGKSPVDVFGALTAEEARLEEIDRAAIRRIDDWEFLMEQAKQFNKYKKKVAFIMEESELLREVIQFYADPESYETNVTDQWAPVVPVNKDAGERARNALKGWEPS